MSRIGWRLTVEPTSHLFGWSLLRADAHGTKVWSGLVEDAGRVRERVQHAVQPSSHDLLDPDVEARLAVELGRTMLPEPLVEALADGDGSDLLTICARGWLAQVPWEALALGTGQSRVVERCRLMSGLAPGLVADLTTAARPASVTSGRGLWVVDPGPPDGRWPPLYPTGYPSPIRAAARSTDSLVPDGMGLTARELSELLRSGPWEWLVFVGHCVSNPDSPAAASMVLSGADGAELFSAHAWLREPTKFPCPVRTALVGCGSDDADVMEQTGLVIAALRAGAQVVLATRWSLPNVEATSQLVAVVGEFLLADRVLEGLGDWQRVQARRWVQTGDPASSPLYWAAMTTYDLSLMRSPAALR